MATRADQRGLYRRAVLVRDSQPDSLVRYYVYQLPDPALWTGAQVFVLDEVGGATTCFSDGVNWRRLEDLVIVSAVVSADLSASAAATAIGNGVSGPYLVSPGRSTGFFVGASFVAVALSAAGVSVATLGAPEFGASDLSAAGVSTVTGVGDFGVGEHAGLVANGVSVATLATMIDGEPSGLSAAGKSIALLEGATA